MTEFLLLALFPTLVIAAGIGDVLTMRIPNWLNGATALAIVPMAILAGMPLEVVPWHLLAGAVMLVVGFGLFAANYVGGGDAKLMAAAGLWIGWSGLAGFVLITTLAGGILAMVMMVWQFVRAKPEVRGGAWLGRLFRSDLHLPYGAAIAAGALWVYPATWWMETLL